MGTKPRVPVQPDSRRLARGVAAFRWTAADVLDGTGHPRGWTRARRRLGLRHPRTIESHPRLP